MHTPAYRKILIKQHLLRPLSATRIIRLKAHKEYILNLWIERISVSLPEFFPFFPVKDDRVVALDQVFIDLQ